MIYWTARSAVAARGLRLARRRDAAWWTFCLIAAALLPFMIHVSRDFGVTIDERDRHKYGQTVLEVLRGLRSREVFEDGSGIYGGLFDVLCAWLEGFAHVDRYVLRHMIDAVFGWVGIVYCGRLAARLFGGWAGVLAMVLLTTSPRYFADSMNNPKDVPFAAACVVALFYMATISPRWPYLSLPSAVKTVLALALALNIRPAALLYIGYLGLLVAAFMLAERQWSWRRLGDTAVRLALVLVATLLLGTLVWPWAQAAPLTRPVRALVEFSNYPWTGTHVLFAGRDYDPARLPWSYVPWWLLISTPPVVLVGILLSCAPGPRGSTIRKAALWAVAALPLALVVARQSTLYNGIRHLLFTYPPLVVLAAAGWWSWLSDGRPRVRAAVAALLIVGVADVLAFEVRSHPNETVYFNELTGGPQGAFGKYEMDYWGNCVLESVAWTADAARRAGVRLPISGDIPAELVGPDAARFQDVFMAPRPESAFFVQLVRGTPDDQRLIASLPDARYRVRTADGTVLCVVLPGPAFGRFPRLASLGPASLPLGLH